MDVDHGFTGQDALAVGSGRELAVPPVFFIRIDLFRTQIDIIVIIIVTAQ